VEDLAAGSNTEAHERASEGGRRRLLAAETRTIVDVVKDEEEEEESRTPTPPKFPSPLHSHCLTMMFVCFLSSKPNEGGG
jgi:hypothetical protein